MDASPSPFSRLETSLFLWIAKGIALFSTIMALRAFESLHALHLPSHRIPHQPLQLR